MPGAQPEGCGYEWILVTVFRDEPLDVEVKGRPLTYGVIASTSVPGYRPEFGNEDVINH